MDGDVDKIGLSMYLRDKTYINVDRYTVGGAFKCFFSSILVLIFEKFINFYFNHFGVNGIAGIAMDWLVL